tara:strand:+ start:19233 stop:20672 length:1440 start_codon:yes stop_codon:yes gene_type:complete
MSDSAAGIVAWGAYIPATRLPLALIHGGRPDGGAAEKAVAAFDEDAITLGVAAAMECLGQLPRERVDGLYFASTSSPFREKQAAAFVAKALDLRTDINTQDFGGSLRASAGAMLAAVNAVRATPGTQILVVVADTRLAPPRTPLEANLGDAAVALLIGDVNVAASLAASCAITDEIFDIWRGEHDDYLRAWEDRFNVLHGYTENIRAVCERLFAQTGTTAADYARVALYAPDARSHASVGRQLGFASGQLENPLFGRVGNCGTAFAPLLLVAALEASRAGDRLLAVFYGDGAEALVFERQSATCAPARDISWHLQRARPLRSYESFLQSRHLNAVEHDPRGGEGVPATVHYRERNSDIGFLGMRCIHCDTVHFPACRVCYRCHAKDAFEPVRLSDRPGRVLSYSFDYFFPTPEPPLIVGVCEVDNGARVYLQMTDASADEVRLDLPVEFVFRRIHEAGNRPNYFWKSRPLLAASGEDAR